MSSTQSTINLRTGEASNPAWTQGASVLAELGSVQLELAYLAHHTGEPRYYKKVAFMMLR